MVNSEELTPDAITNAMAKGDFYASSGVILSDVNVTQDLYEVSVDTTATYKETESPFIIGYKNEEIIDGFSIEFITDQGEVIKKVDEISASLEVPENVNYVRCKITFSRSRGSSSEQFFAWTQPLFLP